LTRTTAILAFAFFSLSLTLAVLTRGAATPQRDILAPGPKPTAAAPLKPAAPVVPTK
jgi:preprotein translocase subunit SecG